MTIAWSREQLELISAARELHVSTIRRDGTLRSAVPIWVVVVDGGVYVRTWYRRDSGWFGHAVRGRRGRVQVPGVVVDVVVEDIGADDANLRHGIDAGYRAKYGHPGDTSTDRMTTDDAAASTLRLIPLAAAPAASSG